MTYNVAMMTTSFALPENWAKDFQVQKRPVILHEVCVCVCVGGLIARLQIV